MACLNCGKDVESKGTKPEPLTTKNAKTKLAEFVSDWEKEERKQGIGRGYNGAGEAMGVPYNP